MQSLTSDRGSKPAELGAGEVAPVRRLPRPVRRALKASGIEFLANAAMRKPMRSAVVAICVFLAGGYGLASSRDSNMRLAALSADAGFRVEQFLVSGNRNVSEEMLRFQLGQELGKPLLEIDVAAARDKILANSWIEAANVRKVLPSTLIVEIREREPVAVWKRGEAIMLVSRDGTFITDAGTEHLGLPQIVGAGANEAAAELLSVISRFPAISSRVKAYVRVAERRWNIAFRGGAQVLLPEQDWQLALGQLYELQGKQEILDRDIVRLDLRLPDRIAIKLSPDAAEARRQAIARAIENAEVKI